MPSTTGINAVLAWASSPNLRLECRARRLEWAGPHCAVRSSTTPAHSPSPLHRRHCCRKTSAHELMALRDHDGAAQPDEVARLAQVKTAISPSRSGRRHPHPGRGPMPSPTGLFALLPHRGGGGRHPSISASRRRARSPIHLGSCTGQPRYVNQGVTSETSGATARKRHTAD